MKESNLKDNAYFNTLIRKIAKKDKNALDEFYQAYGNMIYSIARLIARKSALCDEIVNDVLIKVWQFSAKRKHLNAPLGWLYVVTVNCAKDKMRAQSAFVELQSDSASVDFNCDIENYDAFVDMIAPLNDDEKQIMILKFVQDLTFAEIARAMNKKLSTVTAIYYRALQKIKDSL